MVGPGLHRVGQRRPGAAPLSRTSSAPSTGTARFLRSPPSGNADGATQLASKYGIDAFCYYHYWFHGRRVLDRPFAEVLSSGTPDLPFCLCWANESWTRSWDGRSGHVLLEQRYSKTDDREHLEALLPALTDRRYLRFENRPVLLVYRSSQLPDPRRTTEAWREVAAAAGLELYLLRVESFLDETGDPRPLGFDAAVDFQPDWSSLPESAVRRLVSRTAPRTPRVNDRVLSYRRTIDRMLRRPAPSYPRWPGVFPTWDNTARRRVGATCFTALRPNCTRRGCVPRWSVCLPLSATVRLLCSSMRGTSGVRGPTWNLTAGMGRHISRLIFGWSPHRWRDEYS